MAAIESVSADSFFADVEQSSVPVLVDFWASWCQPCLRMEPIVEEVAEEFAGRAKVVKVNVDDERTLAAQFQIMSIPTFIIFSKGKNVEELSGVQTAEELSISLESFCE